MNVSAGNAFDKIRWVAASAVLLSHSFPLMGLPEPMLLGDSLGKLAVMVFFAVSGYLVCQSWDRDPHPVRFVQRRALRLLPGLVVAVPVTALGIGALVTTEPVATFWSDRATWAYVASNITLAAGVEHLPGVFTHNPETIFNGSLWTLRYEASVYAILVLGALAAGPRVACSTLFVAGLATLATLSFHGVLHFTLPIPGIWQLGLQFDAIRLLKLGTVFFCAASLYLWRRRIALRRDVALALALALAACPAGPALTVLTAVAVPYVTLVVALASPASWHGAWAADLSYGIYVYAYPVQQAVSQFALRHDLGWPFAFAVAIVITLILAALSWTWVERPALLHKPRRRVAVPVFPRTDSREA